MTENINNLSQALVSSMEILARSGDQSLTFDKTIECDIIKAVDPATGEYKVRYLNGTISAYDISLEMKYKAGDEVYVQVPQNDMSLKKLIIGKKSTKASDLVEVVLDTERVDKIGLPLESIYNLSNFSNENGIIGSTLSNRGHFRSLYVKPSNKEELNNQNILLQNYAFNQTLLLIEGKFKTSWFENDITTGNYGLELIFNLKDNAGQYIIVLDRQSMRGNSLLYTDWTSITGLLNIEGDRIESLEDVRFFSENFKRTEFINESDLQNKYSNGEYEIFVKDISISFVQEAKTFGYTVNIRTPDGIYFSEVVEKKELRLQAIFKYNGQELKTSKAKYYWYRHNPRIGVSSEKFNELAGVGWELIEGFESEKIISLDFFGKDSISQLYKVVVVYEDYICENEILIFKTTNSDDYELHLVKDINNIGILTLKNNSNDDFNLSSDFVYEWSSVNNSGLVVNYAKKLDDDNTNTSIANNGLSLINIYLNNIVGYTTYYCNVFSKNGIPIITVSKTVQNIPVVKDFDVTFIVNNDGFYSYDTRGDYISDVVQKNIDFVINWKDEPTAYYYQWIPTTDIEKDEDGKEFLSYKNKMFEGVTPDDKLYGNVDPNLENSIVNSSYSFKVRNRYYAEKAENNIIQLDIIIDGITYTFRKNLIFLKEGASGTNGTSLMVKVEPDGNVALTSEKGSSIILKCTLYYNGQTTYNSRPICDYFNVKGTVPYDYWGETVINKTSCFLNPFIEYESKTIDGKTSFVPSQQITIEKFDNGDNEHIWLQVTAQKDLTYNLDSVNSTETYCRFNSIIQLAFTPKDETQIFNYNLYKLYGVPLVQMGSTSSNINIRKYFVTGAKEVVYDANGYNPQYAETEYKIYAESATTEPLQPTSFGYYLRQSKGFSITNKILTPWTYFDKSQIGAVYFSFNDSSYYTQPIIFMTNLFSERLLNAWDGTSLQIDDKNSTVLASQVGAGKKDEDNKFTGVLMGEYSTFIEGPGNKYVETGLLGFYKGESTFGLLDSGDAYFGKSGFGRIEFLTSAGSALIRSGNYISSTAIGKQNYCSNIGGLVYSNMSTWDQDMTGNTVITFESDRGKNLNSLYYSIDETSSPTCFKIKIKEKDVITQTIISYYKDENNSEYRKKTETQVENNIKELVNGGWRLSDESNIADPVIKETEINEETYQNSSPEASTTTINYKYYLYIYDNTRTGRKVEYIRIQDDNEATAKKLLDDEEINRNDQFTIHTTEAVGQGMKIDLTDGKIDAADFKLQSKTILINSEGEDSDYAIKIGSNASTFFIRHNGTGMIGGWTISKNRDGIWSLYAGDAYLSSDGRIIGVDIQGSTISGSNIFGSAIKSTYLEAFAGKIGGWKIEYGGLSSGSSYLYSSGSLKMGFYPYVTTINSAGVTIGEYMSITSRGISMGDSGQKLNITTNGISMGSSYQTLNITTDGISIRDWSNILNISNDGIKMQQVVDEAIQTFMTINGSYISIYAGDGGNDGTLYFDFGSSGLALKAKKGYDEVQKILLGCSIENNGLNKYTLPFLQLGAGSNSDGAGVFQIKKNVDHLWIGEWDGSLGITFYPSSNTIDFVGNVTGIIAKLVD